MHPLFRSATLLLAAQMTFYAGFGQIGIGTNTPDPNSALTIFSTTKGVLIPRLGKAEQTILAGTLTTGETGMLIADSLFPVGRLLPSALPTSSPSMPATIREI